MMLLMESIILPPPDTLVERIADCEQELRSLRRLLRMARAAQDAEEARQRRRTSSVKQEASHAD
jgi:hypothetical protein